MTEYFDGLRVEKEKNSAVPRDETGDELKPCPFCGSPGRLVEREWSDDWVVQCERRFKPFSQCPVNSRTRSNQSRPEAIAGWNTRSPAKEEMK